MIINHNMNAANAHRNMAANNVTSGKSMEKLSSGLRINRAGDDAAGLAISEKMRGQIRGLDQASRNAQDGISMIQTAEGALNETHSILQRMRELSNQSANGTNTEIDRKSIQDEMNQLTSEVNRIGNTTEFNTQKLLNGGIGSNGGSKVTQATSAKVTATGLPGAAAAPAGLANTNWIKVDGTTFNLGGVVLAGGGVASDLEAIGNATSGGTKLSEVADIKVVGGNLEITAKSKGLTSTIEVGGADLGITATTAPVTGKPTTIERAGLQATKALDHAGAGTDINVLANSTFDIAVGSESPVKVTLDAKNYNVGNADKNVAKLAMNDLVKDLNEALQKSGLSGKVSAALSEDNKVQFISETGKDLKLTDGTNTPVASFLMFTAGPDLSTPKNVNQVVGPGVQGAGFNTTFQIGANKGQSMTLNVTDMRAAALGITGNAGQAGFTKTNEVTDGTTDVKQEASLNVMTKEDASKSIAVLDKAIASVSSERGKLGSLQNRLEHTIANLGTSSENLQSAESRIRDVDMAKEMLTFSKNNILSQASQAMLAQAKQQPEAVLQLLR